MSKSYEKIVLTVNSKLNRLKFRLKSFQTNSIDQDDSQKEELSNQAKDLDSRLETFLDEICSLGLTPEDLNSYLETGESLKVAINKFILEVPKNPPSGTWDQKPIVVHSPNPVPLPHIKLPTFDGNIVNWETFYDLFNATVHSNKNIGDAQKMAILKGHLTGTAAALIQSYKITEANYPICLQVLKDQYENKKEIQYSLIDRLLTLPDIKPGDSASIIKLVTETRNITNELKSQGIDLNSWNVLVVRLLMKHCDTNTLETWLLQDKEKEIASFESFLSFLLIRAKSITTTSLTKTKPTNVSSSKPKTKTVKENRCLTTNISTEDKTKSLELPCFICNNNHQLIKCDTFLKLSPKERYEKIKASKRCIQCFGSSHSVSTCKRFKCKTCNQPHHTLLHFSPAPTDEQKPTSSSTEAKQLHVKAKSSNNSVPILSTAIVYLTNISGKVIKSRFLVDSASEISILSARLADKLKLKLKTTDLRITGVGSSPLPEIHYSAMANISSGNRNHEPISGEFYIVNDLNIKLPSAPIDIDNMEYLDVKSLADPDFHIPSTIDGILGAEMCSKILTGEKKKPIGNGPSQFNSIFGWLLLGVGPSRDSLVIPKINFIESTSSLSDPPFDLYWSLEKTLDTPLPSQQSTAEAHYTKTTRLLDSNRVEVSLPFRVDPPQLGSSIRKALKVFNSLEGKFGKNPEFFEKYRSQIRKLKEQGHVETVGSLSTTNLPEHGNSYFLPHSAVPKKDNEDLRIVFNGSATTTNGISLNDTLETGDVLQTDIRRILCSFRSYRFVICMDIKNMFLQIQLPSTDRRWLQFLWRDSPVGEISILRFTRVPFGLKCSPFLAIRTLHYLADKFANIYPRASTLIKTNSYVDDFLIGSNDQQDLIQLTKEITIILQNGNFTLGKWRTNVETVFQTLKLTNIIPEEQNTLSFSQNAPILGLNWNPLSDKFQFQFKTPTMVMFTKRGILSELQKIFDPLGFLNPCTIKFRIIFQKLWLVSNLGWDSPVSSEIQEEWSSFREEISTFNDIRIERHCIHPDGNIFYLCGFADASENAYGCCIYLCSYKDNTFLQSSLLYSKTRVKPLKYFTLPRLELLGVHLLSKCIDFLISHVEINITACYCYTDSRIVLNWIHQDPHLYKTYVANRISEVKIISSSLNISWFHIAGTQNPADLVTRGLTASQLTKSNWFTGPIEVFTSLSTITKYELDPLLETPEEENKKRICVIKTDDLHFLNYYSSFYKLRKAVAILHKFLHFLIAKRKSESYIIMPIQTSDLQIAHNSIIRYIQKKHFGESLRLIKNSHPLRKSDPLINFSPFLDDEGIMRVGGRLENASLSYSKKHPIILPRNEPIVKMIVTDTHFELLHCGAQLLKTILSRRYWIIRGRILIRQVIHNCVPCTKQKLLPYSQLMSPLPSSRVTPAPVFSRVGLDFFGPFFIYLKRGRGSKKHKAYGLICVCFVTHAVHLELISDLSTDTFLLALQRFISKRGIPEEIYSDNGTTFIGAERILKKEFQQLYNLCESPET